VFGAKRLPEMGRSLGEGLRGFKESIGGDGHGPQLRAVHAETDEQVQDTREESTPLHPAA
jgi:Sec-independent protein translocase protein TatA